MNRKCSMYEAFVNSEKNKTMNICVFGAASPLIDQKYMDAAFEAGALLAKEGHKLVFGGGGDGMMGAAARGFHSEGGHVTGILPEFFGDVGITENLYKECDEVIYTEDISERISMMKAMSDAFLVLPGGTGTYEEFFTVLVSGYLGRHEKKLAVYNVSGFFNTMLRMLQEGRDKGFISEETMQRFRVFTEQDVEELVRFFV